MSKKNELAVVSQQLGTLFSGVIGDEASKALIDSDSLSQGSKFLKRIQLFSGGKLVKKKLIEEGHFGVPLGAEKVTDLGESIDLLVIWRKPKAIDMSDTDNLIVSNDPSSSEFKRIVEMADHVKDSGCAYGPAYLVYERSTGQFYEFFAGNASGRVESSNINNYLPVTQQAIAAGKAPKGVTEPRFCVPMTLRSQYVEKGKFSWFAPKSEDCLTPFDYPGMDVIQEQMKLFMKKEDSGVKTVSKEEAEAGRTSRKR